MTDTRTRLIAQCKQWSDIGQREHAVAVYLRFKELFPELEL